MVYILHGHSFCKTYRENVVEEIGNFLQKKLRKKIYKGNWKFTKIREITKLTMYSVIVADKSVQFYFDTHI